jgi:DnaJ family protein C protein 17
MSSTFGPVDKDSIVLSVKPPKKAPHKPPKYATAAVPFKTIADAHAAVCASRRADRGLDEFEIGWMGGCEPAVWSWAERMLKSKEQHNASASATPAPGVGGTRGAGGVASAASPAGVGVQDYSDVPSNPVVGSQFSSFPSSLVRIHVPCPLLASPTSLTSFTVSSPLRGTSSLRSWPGFRVGCSHADAASREGTVRARDPRAGG